MNGGVSNRVLSKKQEKGLAALGDVPKASAPTKLGEFKAENRMSKKNKNIGRSRKN